MEAVPSMDDLLDEAEVEIRSPNNSTFHSALSSFPSTPFTTPKTHHNHHRRDDPILVSPFTKQSTISLNQSQDVSPDKLNHSPDEQPMNGNSEVEILERTQDVEEQCVGEEKRQENHQEMNIGGGETTARLTAEERIVEKPTTPKKSLFSQNLTMNPTTNEDKDFEEALAYLGIGEENKEEIIGDLTSSSDAENQVKERKTHDEFYGEPSGEEPEPEEIPVQMTDEPLTKPGTSKYDKEEILGWVHEMIEEMIYESVRVIEFLNLQDREEEDSKGETEEFQRIEKLETLTQQSEDKQIIEELVDELINQVLEEILSEEIRAQQPESSRRKQGDPILEWRTQNPLEAVKERPKKAKEKTEKKKVRREFGFPEDIQDEGVIVVDDDQPESGTSVAGKKEKNGEIPEVPTSKQEEKQLRVQLENQNERIEGIVETGGQEVNDAVEVIEAEDEDHAEMAIEVAEGLDLQQESSGTTQRPRFEEQVIAVVHDMAEETNPMLLTESELKLGKTKPYWIPDSDCVLCMLCSVRFTLLVRRHHCRACGRVLCAACCNERATLVYLGDDEKKNKQRVCQPCLTMLDRIKEYENALAIDEVIDGGSSSRTRSVLKSRAIEVIAAVDGEEAGPSSSSLVPSTFIEGTSVERKRSVVFRDGIRPGDSRVNEPAEQSAVKALKKKPSRKRVHVTQKLASLKLEEEMASFLPKDGETLYIVRGTDGTTRRIQEEAIESRLKDDLSVEIILKRNLSCVLQRSNNPTKPNERIFSVSSRGFFAVGIDEMVYIWSLPNENEEAECKVPVAVLQRVSEMFESCLDVEGSGVRPVISRLPSIHSSTHGPSPPCSTHILVYRPSVQEVRSLSIEWPPHPFVVGISIHDKEFIWALALPNRLLLRLGLLNSWYPCPLINAVSREPVYGTDTNNTVLKVFTDFREWSYRMPCVPGSTVILKENETDIRIPYLAKQQIKEIVESNSRMIAWQCGISQEADSHLVCVEEGQSLTTQLLAKGHSRQVTGASFVIFDSGLKSAEDIFQVTIVEDGIAVRMSGEHLEKLVESLLEGKDWQTISSKGGGEVRVRWKASGCFSESSHSQLLSPIDGLYLGDHFQYGLSLSRALSTAIQVSSSPDYTVRLSHVFHMGTSRIPLEDEAKIFSVAEMMARESTKHMDTHIAALMAMGIDLIAIRCLVSDSDVSLDISQWNGLEQERSHFSASMDELLPILYGLLEYLPGGVHLELHLSIVSSKDPLPFE